MAPYGAIRYPRGPYDGLMAPYGTLCRPAAPCGALRRRPMAPYGAIGPDPRQPMGPCGALPAWWPSPASPTLGLPPLPTRLPRLGSNKNELEIYVK